MEVKLTQKIESITLTQQGNCCCSRIGGEEVKRTYPKSQTFKGLIPVLALIGSVICNSELGILCWTLQTGTLVVFLHHIFSLT